MDSVLCWQMFHINLVSENGEGQGPDWEDLLISEVHIYPQQLTSCYQMV
jgi:hypothetical protein